MSILIKLYCFFSLILFATTSFAFSGGTGTQEDPYLLRTCPELQSMIGFPSAHFQLADNINCNGFDYGDGKGFMPVGTSAYPFIGMFDGNNFIISYLNINRPTQDYVGLIGYMGGQGSIKNLTVIDSLIIGRSYTGGVVGFAAYGTGTIVNLTYEGEVIGNSSDVGGLVGRSSKDISNSHAIANVTGTSYAGGLVGSSGDADIINSSAIGQVKSTSSSGSTLGGLVGSISGSTSIFEKNYTNTVVTGNNIVGGLIGSSSYVNIKTSFANAIVDGNENVGTFIGSMQGGSITDSYAQGEAHADHYVGGLIGNASSSYSNVVTNTYAAAVVTGTIYTGGLIGYGTATVNNSYWDRTVSGQPYSVGGTPKTTEEMYQQATYVNWNFNNTWVIDENVNYPQLQWVLTQE